MIRRFALLFFGSLTLLLSSGLPLYFFFGNGGSSEADWNGRVGEMWALGPQFGSGLGGQPEIGVKSAEIMETSYAVDTYGNKYRVFAAERECLMVCVWEPIPHKEISQNEYCGETRSGR